MTYNQSVLNKYRSELLQEQEIEQENTSHYKHNYNLLEASPEEPQEQKRTYHNLLHVEQEQKANNAEGKKQKHNVRGENTVDCSEPHEAKEESEKQWTNNETSDMLLMIKRFKSKTCPYCNGERSAAVKHINPHTKPSTPQAFYNDILINKYRHVQSTHAQRNLSLQINVGCKANKEQNHNGIVSLQSTHLHSYSTKEIYEQNFHQEKGCSEQQKAPNQFNSESKAVASQENTAKKEVQKLQHETYTNNNNESVSVSVKCNNRESTNSFSKSKLFVLGPMVDQSELPFRMLCREYGATVAFTPMLHAKNFVESAQYRQRFYSTTSKREVLEGLHLHNEYHHYEEQQEECRTEEDLHEYSGNESCELQQQEEYKEEKEKEYEMQMNDVTNDNMEVKHGKLIDRPLVVQICGNDADTILAAARLALYSDDYKIEQNDKRSNRLTNSAVKDEMSTTECDTNVNIVKLNENEESEQESSVDNTIDRSDSMSNTCPLYSCDAVDINLGCPQGIAKRGHYGSFLMEDWERIHTIIHTLHVELEVPVTAKIRVFDKPRSATHNGNNNNSDSNKNTNSDSNNNSALSTKCTKCNRKDDIEVNNENGFAECGTSDVYCEKCAKCEQTLLEPTTVSCEQHHHEHQQSSNNENTTYNMEGKGESKHYLHCQNGQEKEMSTLETHDKFNKVVQQEDCYMVRCTKQDSSTINSNSCSCSSDDSLEYDAALTIAYAMMIRDAGAQMLTIHGRTRAMKGQNTKLANLTLIRDIHAALNGSIPVIANGNVLTFDDVMYNVSYTQCEGVMCAEPLLWDPSLFAHPAHPILCGRSFAADKITRLRSIQLALRYLTWCTRYPIDLGMIKAHLYKLCYHSYEIHHTLRNALAHVCDDANLLPSSSIQEETAVAKTKDEKTTAMCCKSSQDNLHENGCKDNKVGIDHSSTYMKQLGALRRHLHELYMIEKASSITGPQPKLLRLAKEASRAEVHANNFFDDANVDETISHTQSVEAETNINVSSKNNEDNSSNTVGAICDEDYSNLGIVF